MLYALNEGIHGNMGGMGKSVLYRQAKSGTKVLVEQYIQEIDDALRLLAELPDEVIPTQQKLDFFYRSNVCYGRSALMLSGGAFSAFYMSVWSASFSDRVSCPESFRLQCRFDCGRGAGGLYR